MVTRFTCFNLFFIFLSSLFAHLFLITPASDACPLVIRAGAPRKAQVTVGGYCRINGTLTQSAPVRRVGMRERAYITNSDGDSFSIVDRKTYQVLKTLPVGDYPHHMIVSKDGRHLYIGNTHSDTVSTLDLATEEIVKTIPLLDPYNFYYSPDGELLVTTCTRLGRVEVHEREKWTDMNRATGWKPIGPDPHG